MNHPEVDQKNARALAEAIKLLREEVGRLQTDLNQQKLNVNNVIRENASLRTEVMLLKAASIGSGSTELE